MYFEEVKTLTSESAAMIERSLGEEDAFDISKLQISHCHEIG